MALKNNKILKISLITLFWLLVWEICSLIIGKPLLFPSPIDVIIRLGQLIITEDFIVSILLSITRIGFGIIIAVVSGSFTAIICSLSKLIYETVYPLVTIVKSTPVASFIILIWIFIGSDLTPIVISSLMVFPIVFANVYQGIKNVDASLLEMCKVYNIPNKKKIPALYIPSVLPYFTSALLSSIGLGWKAGIAAEVLCTPIRSIGKAIFESKLYFEYVDLFAWTAAIIVISMIFEIVFTRSVSKLLTKIKIKYGGKDNGN